MTDNEIIKAYEMCYLSDEINCGKCAFTNCPPDSCKTEMTKSVFDLINRQKAGIERLKRYDEERDIALHARLIANAKTEAIREFAEKLKNVALPITIGGKYEYEVVTKQAIDHFVKEMTEGENV